MWVSTEIGEFPGERRRAVQPPGAVFALGWVMAQLFDPRRRERVTTRQPPFDPDVQLPLADDLAADPKLVFLADELAEYLHWFPALAEPLRQVTAQTNKRRAAIAAGNLATAQAAEEAGEEEAAGPADPAVTGPESTAPEADDAVYAAAAGAAAAADTPFSETELLAAVAGLNQAILDHFADQPQRLCAYQLGLSLSDLVWLPSIAPLGKDSAASRPSALFGLFARPSMTGLHTLLNGTGGQLPAGIAAIVSKSLDNWAEWIDVNSARIKSPGSDTWSPESDTVLRALRVQGWVWRSALVADTEVTVQPSTGAWAEAGTAVARAAAKVCGAILRRFWPVVLIALAALGGLLALVIVNLSGTSQVWASLVTVAAVVGTSGWGLGSGVSSALSGVGYEIWNAAKTDAAAWNITWLPALSTTTLERAKMDRRGVPMPHVRKSLDIS
ncbi:MAG TPA: hypothetical protein VF838_02745 [Trebonia sp.]